MRKTRKPGLQIPTPKAGGLQIRQNSRSAHFPLKGVVGALLLLMLFFVIFTASQFPYTYITMEGDDFWVLTKDFWQLKLGMLPAFTSWLADFLMQFYRSPYIAATIQAMILGMIGVLAASSIRLLQREKMAWLSWLGLLPSILLGYFCTFNLSFQLQCLFFFGLLNIFLLIPNTRGKFLFSIACVPVGFLLMRTPMLGLLLIIQYIILCLSDKYHIIWNCTLILWMVTPLAYSQQVAFIPFEKRYMEWGTYFEPLTSRQNQDSERIKKCVCLANEGRWGDLLYKEQIRHEAQRGKAASLRYALLAESALGTLPENLWDYPIQDENQFLYPHQTEYVASQFNRLFYLNLNIYDEAFHHAEEYGLLQQNGVCFSSLRQMTDYSIEEGDFEIAEKYLNVLSRSSCHKAFVKERRKNLANRKSANHQTKPVPLRADNFVGGFPLPIEMLRLARYYQDPSQRKKMVDYAICSYMLRNDANSFLIATKAFDVYKEKELPKAYRQFLERYSSTASTASSVSNPLERR